MVECFDEEGSCVISPACKLHRIISEALNAYIDTLRKYSLRDLVDPNSELAGLLQVERDAA